MIGKLNISRILALVLVATVFASNFVFVESVKAETLYEYEVLGDGTIKITGYSGEVADNLTIPNEIDGYTVSTIGSLAFENCSATSLTLASDSTITTIEEKAFYNSSLETVSLYARNVSYIGKEAFSSMNTIEMTIKITNGAGNTMLEAFSPCNENISNYNVFSNINIVTNESNVIVSYSQWLPYEYDGMVIRYIVEDNKGFFIDINQAPSNLEVLTIPTYINSFPITVVGSGLDKSGLYATTQLMVSNNNVIKKVIFPKDTMVDTLSNNCFKSFTNLEEIEGFENTKVRVIPSNAFNGLESLKYIQFPSTLEVIGYQSFCRCNSLENIDLSNTVFTGDEFILGNDGKQYQIMADYWFCYSNVSIYDVKFPSTFKKLGSNVFSGRADLQGGNGIVELDFTHTQLESMEGYNIYTDFTYTGDDYLTLKLPKTLELNNIYERAIEGWSNIILYFKHSAITDEELSKFLRNLMYSGTNFAIKKDGETIYTDPQIYMSTYLTFADDDGSEIITIDKYTEYPYSYTLNSSDERDRIYIFDDKEPVGFEYPSDMSLPTKADDEDYYYVFDKWVTTQGGTEEASLLNIEDDTTVYASYTAIPKILPTELHAAITYKNGETLLSFYANDDVNGTAFTYSFDNKSGNKVITDKDIITEIKAIRNGYEEKSSTIDLKVIKTDTPIISDVYNTSEVDISVGNITNASLDKLFISIDNGDFKEYNVINGKVTLSLDRTLDHSISAMQTVSTNIDGEEINIESDIVKKDIEKLEEQTTEEKTTEEAPITKEQANRATPIVIIVMSTTVFVFTRKKIKL